MLEGRGKKLEEERKWYEVGGGRSEIGEER